MGTDPAKRAFYRAFRDFNPLNDLGIGSKPRRRLFPGGRRNGRDKSAALGMDRDEHLFSRYGEWRRGKFVAGGFGAEIVRLV